MSTRPSAKAIELVAQRYDASKRYADFAVALSIAEEALLKRLANGALRAKSAKGQMRWGDPFSTENKSDFENDCLPTSFWSNLSSCEYSNRQIDWVFGDFSYSTGYNESSASGNAFDVRFEVSGILGADGAGASDNASLTEHKNAGRPARFDWPRAVVAIFGLIHKGDFKPVSQAEIERALIVHLSDENRGPSENTVRPYAKLIWDEHKKA